MMKTIRKILDIAITVVLAVVIICNTYIVVAKTTGRLQPAVFGYSTAVVVSGSMADAINVNDLVVVKEQSEYAVGDVISFENGSSVVTHRIVREENGEFITKGDANNTEDEGSVKAESIVGKVVLTVPQIGAVIGFFQTQLGMAIMAAALVIIIFASSFSGKKESKN